MKDNCLPAASTVGVVVLVAWRPLSALLLLALSPLSRLFHVFYEAHRCSFLSLLAIKLFPALHETLPPLATDSVCVCVCVFLS